MNRSSSVRVPTKDQKAFPREAPDVLLRFDTLDTAEQTLLQIHRRFCEFRDRGDHENLERCRMIILTGKKRATMISRNKRVGAKKREEKAEIAQWFTVWLQTPDVFCDWLSLRKKSADFQNRFCDGIIGGSP